MLSKTDSNPLKLRLILFIFLTALTIFRLYYIQSLPLSEDEANYWQWSRHLDWGYYDQGPMVAWTIKLGTIIFGQTEFGVRVPAVVMILVLSLLYYQYGRRVLEDEALGLWLALAVNSALLFAVGAIIHTYDTPLCLFWLLGLYFTAAAVFRNRPRAWYWSGLAVGLALLAKYTAILLPALVLAFLLFNPRHRFWLRRREPWLAVLIAGLIFTPNLVWNATHQWAAINHTFRQAGGGAWKFTAFEFLAGQAGLVGPVGFVLLVTALSLAWRRAKAGDDRQSFLLWTSVPVLLLFLVLSAKGRIQGNWPAPGYMAAVISAVWIIKERTAVSAGWRRWAAAALVTGYLFVALAHFHVPLVRALNLAPDSDPTIRLYGWPELGREVGRELDRWPGPEKPFLFSLRYHQASLTAFYAPGQPQVEGLFLPGFRLTCYVFWTDPRKLKGRDGLAVVDGRPNLELLFDRVDLIREVELTGPSGAVIHRLTLYGCRGFKGRDYRPASYLSPLGP
ncbi:MAG: glycosyltransferase family 39 protein [Thermodesulfobacteriota bacterium]